MRRGCDVLARNLRVGRSEIDLVVRDGCSVVVVEVKTRTTADPASRFDQRKAFALRRAVSRMHPRPDRIDLVTVEMGEGAATIVWRKGVV